MESNKEILDKLGKKIIEDCFDPTLENLNSLRKKENPPIIFEKYVEFLKKMDNNDFEILNKYLRESLGNFLFDILRIFEENDQFKLYYEAEGQKINLVEISENLKAEPIIEDGWIDRFSEEKNNKEE